MLDAYPYPPDLRDFVAQKIAAGEFTSADDFAIQAAKVYREMDSRHQKLKESIAAATAELDSGEYIELNGEDELHEFFEELKREGRRRLAEAAKGA